jgi:hypothetical protein
VAASDGAGGAIVMWVDSRQWPEGIYAQRVDANGVPQWTSSGVLLRYPVYQFLLRVVDDEAHGAIAVWGGQNSLGVQRVSADGIPLWGSNGVVLRDSLDQEHWPELVPDGHGGAIVVWTALYPSMHDTLFAARIDSSGDVVWETRVRTDTLDMAAPCACADGEGGVILAWYEYSGYSGHWAVRAQRVDSAGGIKWDAAGVSVCTSAMVQYSTGCVAVSGSCFVVGWLDGGGGNWQHRAQMFDMAGNRLWGLTGMPISDSFNSNTTAVGLPTGDARQSVWVWEENRTGTHDIFAQKLDSAGVRCWDSSGVWVGTTDTVNGYPFSAAADGKGGAIAAWPLCGNAHCEDIYAQHVDSAGRQRWSDTGLAVCRDSNRQKWTPAIVTDGDGGAIIAWLSYQSGVGSSICAQRVADGAGVQETMSDEYGVISTAPTVIRGVLFLAEATSPKPQAANLMDAAGRKVAKLHKGANDVSALAPGVYFVREEPWATRNKLLAKVVVTR